MAEEAGEDGAAVAESLEGTGDSVSEPAQAGEAAVAEFDVLEVAPEVLDRIEVGCIAGEALPLEPGGRTGGQEILDRLTAVGGQAIPDPEELAGDPGEEVLEEADDAGAIEGDTLRQGVDLAVERQGADD